MNDVSMVIVKVGAMFINSIEIVDEGDVWKKGNEIGLFFIWLDGYYCYLRRDI